MAQKSSALMGKMRKGAIRALLVVVCLTLIGQVYRIARDYSFGSPGADDFVAYWGAGRLLLQRKNPYDFYALYDIERAEGLPYENPVIVWNPPWTLTLMLPLALLPFNAAALLWLGINSILIFTSSTLIWHLFTVKRFPGYIGVAWVATLTFVPVLFTLRMGQISSLILLGVVGFLFFALKGGDIAAGAFLALTTLKPHVVYLLLVVVGWWIVSRRRWGVLTGFVGAVGVSVVISLCLSPSLIKDYLVVLQEPPLYWRNPVIGTLLRACTSPQHSWLQFVTPAILSLLTLAFLIAKNGGFDWREAVSPILLASVPTAAYGWSFDQIVLLIPYLQIVTWLVDQGRRRVGDSLLVLMALFMSAGLMIWQNRSSSEEFYYFWMPLALTAVYVYGRLKLSPKGDTG